MRKSRSASLKRANVVFYRQDFSEREFVGFSAGLEWIARQDRKLSGKKYLQLIQLTLERLVSVLGNPVPGMTIEVEGIDSVKPENGHVQIPREIWRSVGISDREIGVKEYSLMLMDDNSIQFSDEEAQWGGALIGKSGRKFNQLQFKSTTVIKLASSFSAYFNLAAVSLSLDHQVKHDQIENSFEMLIGSAPESLIPFTLDELEKLGKARFPDIPREKIRDIAKKHVKTLKRGPRGPRNLQRKQIFDEFLENIVPAKLQN